MLAECTDTPFLNEPAPCDDCPQRTRCRDSQVACKAYQYYVRTSAIAPYDIYPREPTKAVFTELYNLPVIHGIFLQKPRSGELKYKVIIYDVPGGVDHRNNKRIIGYFDNYLDACCARRSAEAKAGMQLNQYRVE